MGFREAGKESRNMVVDGEPVVDPRAGRFKTQFTKAGPGKAEKDSPETADLSRTTSLEGRPRGQMPKAVTLHQSSQCLVV